MSKTPLNYFRSREFLSTASIVGTFSVPFIVPILTLGAKPELLLAMLFGGIFGGLAKASKDLESNPNLYTDDHLIGTDRKQAIAYCAKNIAIEKATELVQEQIYQKADEILNTSKPIELVKPYISVANRLRGLFR